MPEADEHQPIRVDGNEIVEAAWFSRGNLPNHSSTISIAGEMIAQFEKGELQGCGEVKKIGFERVTVAINYVLPCKLSVIFCSVTHE